MISSWIRLFCLLALVMTACDRPRLSDEWLLSAIPGANVESESAPAKPVTEETEEEALARRPRVWRPVRGPTLLRLASQLAVRSTEDRFPPPDLVEAPSPVCVLSIPLLC
jgi:hypothetical protein